jgi:hypothetical protein
MKKVKMERLNDYGNDIKINEKDIILVDAPGSLAVSFWLPNYFIKYGKLPNHLRILSPGFTSIEIKRNSLSTLSVRPKGGFYMPPGLYANGRTLINNNYFSFTNFLRRMERLVQDGTKPFKLNQIIKLSNVTIRVMQLTNDSRPAEVEYKFDYPLESAIFNWKIWNKKSLKYQNFILPKVGETIIID